MMVVDEIFLMSAPYEFLSFGGGKPTGRVLDCMSSSERLASSERPMTVTTVWVHRMRRLRVSWQMFANDELLNNYDFGRKTL